jgi:hypothetical protein
VYIPRAALEVTAKDQNGKVVLTDRRKYDNWNLWFEGGKWVELRQWDITAATNVNLGLEPGQPDLKTDVIVLDKNTESVTVEATFLFEHEPGHWEEITKETKTIEFKPPRKFVKE